MSVLTEMCVFWVNFIVLPQLDPINMHGLNQNMPIPTSAYFANLFKGINKAPMTVRCKRKIVKSPVLLSGPVSFVWVLDIKGDNLPANVLFYRVQILTFKQNQT